MVRWLGILFGTVRSCLRTHRELALENLALRQQLAVWKAREPRPRLTELDRIFWACLSRLWTRWRQSLQLVRPETVVGWHRQGFRRYWAWKSRRRSGRPMISRELRDLIRRMSYDNPLWGAPRIHGELLNLRIRPAEKKADEGPLTELDSAVEAMKNVPWTALQELKGDPDVLKKLDDAEKLLKSLRK